MDKKIEELLAEHEAACEEHWQRGYSAGKEDARRGLTAMDTLDAAYRALGYGGDFSSDFKRGFEAAMNVLREES